METLDYHHGCDVSQSGTLASPSAAKILVDLMKALLACSNSEQDGPDLFILFCLILDAALEIFLPLLACQMFFRNRRVKF